MTNTDRPPPAPAEGAADPTLDASSSATDSQGSLGPGMDERVTVSVGPEAGASPGGAAVQEGDVLSAKYRVDGVIGQGGMGVVFAATHLQLQTRVVLKVIRPDRERQPGAAVRLLREARASARLAGEHVVRVMDVGTLATGAPFIVMERLEGRDLGAELRAEGALGVADAVEYVLQACEAVAQAHAAGIIHRDLKPSNLFLTRRSDGSPCVKVLDFGIAKALDAGEDGEDPSLTSSRAALGSPMYMSPEQIRGPRDVDARADVWALGLILFELLTQARPFGGDSAAARLAATAADPPVPLRKLLPDASAALETAILGCLEKDPSRRTPSVAALARALAPFAPPRAAGSIERVEATLRAPAAKRDESLGPRAGRRPRGARALGAGLAALLAAAVVLAGVQAVKHAPGAERGAAGSDAPGPRRAVAVLGFKNLSGKPEAAWLSTALVEMLGTELSTGERIRVVPVENVDRAARDLGVADAAGLAGDAGARKALAADVLVHGTYLVIGEGAPRKVRFDVRIEGASRAGVAASVAETGTEAELFDLVARVGARLRDELGIGALTPRQEDSVRAARPASAEAARLYAEGLSRLRLDDARGAQTSLAAATAADPAYPLAHSALAEAWQSLGRTVEARAEAKRAFDLASGLSREERLLVEGRYRIALRSWDEAISIHRGLFGFFPDNLEYGLLLAQVERRAGRGKDALTTLEALHRLPAPAGEDPRIDIEEAATAEALGDSHREQEAAGRALARAEAAGARYLSARARMPLAWAHFRLGDAARAHALYEQARQLFVALGDRGLEAQALTNLAIVEAEQGKGEEARRLFEAALAIQRALGNRFQVANLLSNTARVVDESGRAAESRALFEEALGIYREENDLRAVARTIGNIGATWNREGDFAAARRAHEEQLAVSRKLGDDESIRAAGVSLAGALFALGDLAGAKVAYDEALALCRKAEEKDCAANSLSGLGEVLFEQAELPDAAKRCEEALALRVETGAKGAAARIRLQLAALALERGEAAQAEALAREAGAALHEAEQVEEASADALLLAALLAQGKRAEAETEAARVAPRLTAVQTLDDRVPLALALARVEVASGKAASGLRKVETLAADLAHVGAGNALEVRLALGELERASGRPAGGARLQEVARDATKLGFVRLARRAAARR
jgi:tetratricopeptide (TPR) repeat protein/tRNA A-37 threonylcarbamoyl transferase component Bud32/TolB-like protein